MHCFRPGGLLVSQTHQSGADAVGVVVVPVVVAAIRLHTPDVVRVVGVRRPEPPHGSVRNISRTLYAKRISAMLSLVARAKPRLSQEGPPEWQRERLSVPSRAL